MLKKLTTRYASHANASKIMKISKLVSLQYRNEQTNITKHVYLMAAVLQKVKATTHVLDEALAIGILWDYI